jgi:hypothetical protein
MKYISSSIPSTSTNSIVYHKRGKGGGGGEEDGGALKGRYTGNMKAS